MDELDDIRLMDEDLDAFDALWLSSLVALNRSLVDEVRSLIDSLTLRGRATTSDEVRANLRAVTMWRADLPMVLERVGLSDLVQSLTEQMMVTSVRIHGYYGRTVPDFAASQFAGFAEQLTARTRLMLTDTVVGTYGPVLDEVLNWGVLTKYTGAEMRTALVAKLADTGMVVKHVSQVSSDALYTFSRGYSQLVADGLNLKHYYYMGTETAGTRGFCHDRIGRAYTQKEVEQWATLSWAGKIPGTTAQSIYWYCGGYNCRHRLMPITKNAYSIFNNGKQ